MKTIFGHLFALLLCLGMLSQGRATPTPNTTYSIDEHNTQQQTGPSTFVVGYPHYGYYQYALFSKIDTAGASLSAAPVLTLPYGTGSFPGGSITFPVGTDFAPPHPTGAGYNRYQVSASTDTVEALYNAVGTGNFVFTLGDATVSPTLPLNTQSPTFPPPPAVISGGNWDGSNIIISPAHAATLNFNTSDFTNYSTGMGGQITYQIYDPTIAPIIPASISQYIPTIGKTQPALSSYTIPAGTLTPGVTYGLEVNYYQVEAENTTAFTGTGISGTPYGASFYTARTMITLVADPFNGHLTTNGVYYSPWFGYYSYAGFPLIYSYNLGYEYYFPATGGMYLYDYLSGHFWYTQSDYYPNLYDFTLNTFIYYYVGNGAPRYFYNYTTGKQITQ